LVLLSVCLQHCDRLQTLREQGFNLYLQHGVRLQTLDAQGFNMRL